MKLKHKIMFSILLLIVISFIGLLVHEAKEESEQEVQESQKPKKVSDEKQLQVFKTINEDYLKNVKPIFQISCFNCHSSQTHHPWYHVLPWVNKLIDSDVKEAKKHLEMTNDFPFAGHGTPSEDLDAIGNVVNKGTMPPFRYRMMHWGSGLSKDDKEIILKWVEESQDKLFWEKNK